MKRFLGMVLSCAATFALLATITGCPGDPKPVAKEVVKETVKDTVKDTVKETSKETVKK